MVTGAAGYLGNHIVRELLARGEQVRATVSSNPSPESLAGLDVELVPLNVHDRESVHRAVLGEDPERARHTIVIHCAGMVSIADRIDKALWATNVIGTQNVIDVCREAQVERLVYVSSVHANPEPPPGTAMVETAGFDPDLVDGAYAKTKAEASRRVLAATDLDRVIVQPTGILGPGDYGDAPVSRLIRDLVANRLPAIIAGGYDFVDARDAADGTIAAALQGRSGQSYLLGADRITLEEIARIVADASGSRMPRVLPIWLARLVVPFVVAFSKLRGTRPIFTNYSLDVVRHNTAVNHALASAELGFNPRPLRETILDTLAWVQSRG